MALPDGTSPAGGNGEAQELHMHIEPSENTATGSSVQAEEPVLSNSLADLAERIREQYETHTAAERTVAETAIQAGLMLIDAKSACRHGEWLPFLGRAGVHERWAARMMQIARSGLKSDTVSEIGGIRATLAYLAKLKLPSVSEILYIGSITQRSVDNDGNPGPMAWIEPSSENAGHFNVTAIRASGECVCTTKPANGTTIQCPDGFFNGLWCTVEMVLDIPHEDRDFTLMPAWIAEERDDCPFLDAVPEPDRPSNVGAAEAPLPVSYIRVLNALFACEADLTRKNFEALTWAVTDCNIRSQDWPNEPRMLATYARIANSDLNERFAGITAAAQLRWGRIPSGGAS